ncbi:MAG: hypothetical protein PHV82_14490, partial [Victivallaceae bacterium]|nr:hypothetical protein [Victivallaceae bacterium]
MDETYNKINPPEKSQKFFRRSSFLIKDYLFYLCLLTLFIPGLLCGYDFNIISNIDEKFAVEEYKKIGVQMGWFYCDCSQTLTLNKDGNIEWKSADREKKIKAVFEKFKGSGIKVSIIPDLWRMVFEPEKSLLTRDRWGRTGKFRCFADQTALLEKAVCFLVSELSSFPNFGGICLDDEAAVMAGGAMNKEIVSGFEKEYGMKVPPLNMYADIPHGIISDRNPILLWNHYQQKCLLNFHLKLVAAIKKLRPECPVYIVPADSWICGKTISIPNSPPETTKTYRLGQLDASALNGFHLYTQYSFHAIDDSGWDKKIATGQCQAQFIPPDSPRTVIPIYDPCAVSEKSISVTAFRRYVLQTFAEGESGIGYWPVAAFTPAHFSAAADLDKNFIKPFCEKTGNLSRLPGRAAILFSTSTYIFNDIWKTNPIERFRHNHQCDALAYFLLKRGIPFDIILESGIDTTSKIKNYGIIISSGVEYLTESCVRTLKSYAREVGKLVFDKETKVKIPEAIYAGLNAEFWYAAIEGQYQRASDME